MTTLKTTKDLAKKLVSKDAGYNYTYKINNTTFEINEFNDCKGWAINEINSNGQLISSYGYEGMLLRECKQMVVMQWNEGQIK